MTKLAADDPYVFNSFDNDYTVTVASDSPTLTVAPMLPPEDNRTTYRIFEGNTQRAQNQSASIRFDVVNQPKVIRVELTAPGVTTNTYTITATRALSDDVSLQEVAVNGTPVLDEDMDRTYREELKFDVETATITAVASNSSATVTIMEENMEDVNGDQRAETSVNLANTGASRTLMIEVTAQNGSTQTYTLIVTRAGSPDATLGLLRVEDATPSDLVLDDDPDVEYNAIIPRNVMTTLVTATANNQFAMVIIGEGEEEITSSEVTINQAGGSQTLRITVTPQSGESRIYTLTVMRTGRAAFDLRDLQVITPPDARLKPTFAIGTQDYEVIGNLGAEIELKIATGPGQRISVDDRELIDITNDNQEISTSFPRVEYGDEHD